MDERADEERPRCTRRTRRKFQSVFSAALRLRNSHANIKWGRKGDRNEMGFGEEIVRMQEEIDRRPGWRAGRRETGA